MLPLTPDCYWVEPGRLLAGEYPGDIDGTEAETKLNALLDAGVRTFVDLTEADELMAYDDVLAEEAQRRGIAVRHVRHPIRDLGIPTRGQMEEILRTIDEAAEGVVYVHCWGGIGRTGTVVGCWLLSRGCAPAGVAHEIRRLRSDCQKSARRSPETWEQNAFVREWMGSHSQAEP